MRFVRHSLGYLLTAVEAGSHLFVDLVYGAAADGVVGPVLEEELPGLAQEGLVGWASARLAVLHVQQVGPGGQRLGVAGQQVLALLVTLLDPHPRREDAGEDVRALAGAEFALEAREAPPVGGRVLGQLPAYRLDDHRVVAVGEVGVVEQLVGGAQDVSEIFLGVKVVEAVGNEDVAGGGQGLERPPQAAEEVAQPLRLGGQVSGDAVAEGQVQHQDLGAVRGPPQELALGRLAAHTAPEDDGVDAEAAQDSRQMGDVSEGVRGVADHHHRAELCRRADADLEVAHRGLAADKKLVGEHVVGADEQAAGLNQPLDVGAAVRAHLQVVVQDDGLPVQDEVPVLGVPVQQVEELVQHAHQAHPERLEGLVPLAVPMGMGDDDEGALG